MAVGVQPRRTSGLIVLILLAAVPAAALFTSREMERIDHEPLFDSEYFLDTLSFSYPQDWDDLWHASTAPAYRINGASLDCCDLMLQQELRLDKRLDRGLSFKFRLLQDENKEYRDFHYRIELEQRLGLGFSAAVFGEPTFRKEDSDIGFGLAHERPGLWRAALRHSFVDFNFNKRGSTSQNYQTYPATDELLLDLKPAEAWTASAYLEIDSPLRRNVPDENRVFSYRRTTVDASLRHSPADKFSSRLSYGYQFEAKGDLYAPTPAGRTSTSARRQVHRVRAAVEGRLTDRDRLEAGHLLLLRAARADDADDGSLGVFYRRWEAQPYARWRRDVRPWLTTELASFLSFGEDRRRGAARAASLYHTVAEIKLGAGTDFVFGPSGRIGLYGTFDLDSPGHPWDGGNIRAMVLF
jgi:hypothetical protein